MCTIQIVTDVFNRGKLYNLVLQLQETLNKKIRDLKLSVDVIAGQANDEERKNDVMEKEVSLIMMHSIGLLCSLTADSVLSSQFFYTEYRQDCGD